MCASSISRQTFPPQGSPGTSALDLVPIPWSFTYPPQILARIWPLPPQCLHYGSGNQHVSTVRTDCKKAEMTTECAHFTLKQPRKDLWKENKAYACKSILSFPLPVSLGFGLTLFQGLFLLPCSASLRVVLVFFVSRSPC